MHNVLERGLVGAVAGALATVPMTAALAIAKGTGFLGEPPPKKLTRRFLMLLGSRPDDTTLNVATTLAHFGYGATTGAVFSLLPRPARNPIGGMAFGVAVWATSYLGWIPKLGLMRYPSKDRPGRPTSMIVAHLVFGAALGALVAFSQRRCGDAPPTQGDI
ncbi:MAG: hypothetical protein ABI867_17325 [Kofleriaceae bacterium]